VAPPSTVKEGKSQTAPDRAPVAAPAVDLGAAVISALGDDTPAAVSAKKPSEPPPTRPERPAEAERASGEVATGRTPPKSSPAGRTSTSKSPAPVEPPPSSVPTVPPSRRTSTPPQGSGGSFGIMVVVCVAAVASYALVSAVRGADVKEPTGLPAPPAPPLVATEVKPAQPVPPTTAPAPANAATPLVGPTDLDLPAGIAVEPGKGLLEVDAPGARDVLVDGVSVGSAPLRQIPLRPGSHEVRLRGEGLDLVRTVDIHEGRRTRLGTTNIR
jgi:PEGA domain